MDYEINISVKNLNETKYLAKVFSLKLKIPFFLSLKGKIGTGKTTFASFFINHVSKEKIKVLSPTFPIINIYKLKKVEIWHYDLYRIKDPKEFFTLDFDVALNHCVLVEWPEIMEEFFPKNRVEIIFKDDEKDLRNLKICFLGCNANYYEEIWKHLKKKFSIY